MPDTPFELPIFYSPTARFSVDADVAVTEFACDLSVCKGACCTMPAARGAPVFASEIAVLEGVLPIVKKYLSDISLETISEKGVWKLEEDGEYTIPTIHGRDCVFVHWDGDVAKCAIQTAFNAEEISGYEKPISCHLFPIRIYPEAAADTFYICYETIDECSGGVVRGEKEHINLLDFLQSPLIRALGEERTELLVQQLQS